MRPKVLLVTLLLLAAYLLGARAGRERYEQIISAAGSFWNDPKVKKSRAKARKKLQKARG